MNELSARVERGPTSLLERANAHIFGRLLDKMDQAFLEGGIHATLPDGSFRILGCRSVGPIAIVELRHWRALIRLGQSGSIGWYQAWEKGEWTSPDPIQLFALFMQNRVSLGKIARASGPSRLAKSAVHWFRRNSKAGAKRNIFAHYDLGNEFYASWLDETMSYSSAVFTDENQSLADAQRNKVRLLLDRLELKPGKTMLEIGCGWGFLSREAANSGAKVKAITLSPSQLKYAQACAKLHPNTPDYQLCDYRDILGQYEAIASVEMVEAVGQQYWPTYFKTISDRLKPGGRAAIQYIAIAEDVFEDYARSADFIQAYVFPGGMLVSEKQFRLLAQKHGLAWVDCRHFGLDYAETLKIWRERFDLAILQGKLPAKFDQRFAHLWRYYLQYCEGGFRGGGIMVAQVTLVKKDGE